MIENEYDELIDDLFLLGRGSVTPKPTQALTPAVMARIAETPSNAWWMSRGRQIAVVIAAVALALLATPPVRAAVSDWFGFGGVVVEKGSPGSGSRILSSRGDSSTSRSSTLPRRSTSQSCYPQNSAYQMALRPPPTSEWSP